VRYGSHHFNSVGAVAVRRRSPRRMGAEVSGVSEAAPGTLGIFPESSQFISN
jgi:hypothetical protein